VTKKSRIKDVDKGLITALQAVQRLEGLKTKVGVQSGTPASADAAPLDMAQLAAVHEFGSSDGNIPARPFMAMTFANTTKARNKLISNLIRRVQDRRLRPSQAIALLGEWYEGQVKKTVRDLRDPPNAASTVAAKGSSNPLVDEGRLIGSIRHEEEL